MRGTRILRSISILSAGLLASLALPTAVSAQQSAAENWSSHCKSCHGPDGTGATAMGRRLKLKDYSEPAVNDSFSDEDIVTAIRDGVTVDGKTRMKPFAEKLSEAEMQELVAFVRGLKKSA